MDIEDLMERQAETFWLDYEDRDDEEENA
jgi:hypothetical protein